MKKNILLSMVLLFILGLTPADIKQNHKDDFLKIRTDFKTGIITDTKSNELFKALEDKYDEDLYDKGIITDRKARKIEIQRRQDLRDRIKNIQDENLQMILYGLLDKTTYYKPTGTEIIESGSGEGGFANIWILFLVVIGGILTWIFRKLDIPRNHPFGKKL